MAKGIEEKEARMGMKRAWQPINMEAVDEEAQTQLRVRVEQIFDSFFSLFVFRIKANLTF